MERHPSDERLRVALLVDSLTQPRWVAKMLDEIVALPFVSLALIVSNDGSPTPRISPKRGKRWLRFWANRSFLLYALYQRLERRFYPPQLDPFVPTNIADRVAACPVVRVRPRMTKFCDYFPDEDVEAILAHDLDVAIRLGFRIIKGRALEIARYGVWSYHHGDNRRYRGGPAGFWEVAENNPVTGAILQVLSEELDAGQVIGRMYSRTERLSVRRNRANYYWKAAMMVPRRLRQLNDDGRVALLPESEVRFETYSDRLYTTPTNREMIPFLGRMVGSRLRNRVGALHSFPQWFFAYRLHSKSSADDGTPLTSFYNFQHVLPPSDRFWADPFPVFKNGERFIFFEEYPYDQGKGHISVIQIDKDGGSSNAQVVLEREYHLAYPHVFGWKGELFMIPETAENRSIELYRCSNFPGDWELAEVLLKDVSAVDATPVQIGDRWWMFTTIRQEGSLGWDDELHLFHAPNPFGPWRPHRSNPVVTDVRSARPAGRLFERGGPLYRPAQDCSKAYGYAITINRILRIDSREYQEISVAKILPNWTPNLLCTHTINSAPGLTVIDGLLRRSRHF